MGEAKNIYFTCLKFFVNLKRQDFLNRRR